MEQLNIRILSDDEDEAIKDATDLKKWIENSDSEVEDLKQVRKALKDDEAGGFFEPEILIALLGTPAIVQLVKVLGSYLMRKKKLKIEVKTKDGKNVKIDMEHGGKTEQEVIDSIMAILKD